MGAAIGVAVIVAGVLASLFRPVAAVPAAGLDPAAMFDPSFLARVEAYRQPLRIARLITLSLTVAVPVAVVCTGWGRRWLRSLSARCAGRPLLAAAATAASILLATSLATLPISFWAGYVHEGAWGFRTTGLAGWVRDWLVARAPAWIAGAAGAAGVTVLVRRLPRDWAAVAALCGAALAGGLVFLAPVVLEPLTYKLSLLENGPVRAEVERVLAAAGGDSLSDRILVADASRRTTKMNAHISGLGATQRIVLHDNLVAGVSPEEVALVLAHEIGHHRNADLARNALASMAATVTVVYAVAWLWQRRWREAPGRRVAPGDIAAALALIAVLQVVSLPAQTWLSRRSEAAADAVALRLTDDAATFSRVQRELATSNLTDVAPPWWATVLWGTHPSPVQRLTAAATWADARDAQR